MLALLAQLCGVTAVAQTGDGREALRLIRDRKPDIALLDIFMPGLNGLEVAARVAKEFPATRVIIVSMHATTNRCGGRSRPRSRATCSRTPNRSELKLALKT